MNVSAKRITTKPHPEGGEAVDPKSHPEGGAAVDSKPHPEGGVAVDTEPHPEGGAAVDSKDGKTKCIRLRWSLLRDDCFAIPQDEVWGVAAGIFTQA